MNRVEWFDINKKLPEKDGIYLITVKNSSVFMAEYLKNDDIWIDGDNSYYDEPAEITSLVIAWAKKPEPYDPIKAENERLKKEIEDMIEINKNREELDKEKISALQRKLEYYEKYDKTSIVWKTTQQEFPDSYKVCLCKCFDDFDDFDETNCDGTNTTFVYKLLVYKLCQNMWFFRNGEAYDGKVIEYAELPSL